MVFLCFCECNPTNKGCIIQFVAGAPLAGGEEKGKGGREDRGRERRTEKGKGERERGLEEQSGKASSTFVFLVSGLLKYKQMALMNSFVSGQLVSAAKTITCNLFTMCIVPLIPRALVRSIVTGRLSSGSGLLGNGREFFGIGCV